VHDRLPGARPLGRRAPLYAERDGFTCVCRGVARVLLSFFYAASGGGGAIGAVACCC
jgi:hypothetical protein